MRENAQNAAKKLSLLPIDVEVKTHTISGSSEVWKPRIEKLLRRNSWEKAAKTRMGKCLTKVKTAFIFK